MPPAARRRLRATEALSRTGSRMATETDAVSEFSGKRVAFVGKLGGVNRREAARLVRQAGGTPVDQVDETVDLIVIGADELPIADDTLLDDSVRDATAQGRMEVISETQFWQRLGAGGKRAACSPALHARNARPPAERLRRSHSALASTWPDRARPRNPSPAVLRLPGSRHRPTTRGITRRRRHAPGDREKTGTTDATRTGCRPTTWPSCR